MNRKTVFIVRIFYAAVLSIALLGLFHTAGYALGLETYGNLYLEINDRDPNENFRLTNPDLSHDLKTYTSGDLFLRGSEDASLLQFLIDYKFEDDLQNSGHTSATGYFNQYYIIIPFHETNFLYCGQKYKHVGVAKFFGISNRYEPAGYPVKLIEYNVLKSDNFNYGFVANFKGASGWDQVQWSGFVDVNQGNFNLQGYVFKEGNRGYSAVTDLTYQAGRFQFYGEALWMSRTDLKVAKLDATDPAKDLDFRNDDGSTKLAAGIMFNYPNYSITLEYMRNNEAYNRQEREDFIHYLDRHPGGRQYYTDYYSYSWAPNYIGLRWYLPTLINSDCSLTNSITASLPDEGFDNEYASYQAYSNLAYNISQNLTVNFNITYSFGGAKGEYRNLYEDAARYQVNLLFSF